MGSNLTAQLGGVMNQINNILNPLPVPDPEQALDTVSRGLNSGVGGGEFGGIGTFIAESIAPIVSIIALLMIVGAGIALVIAQEEGVLDRARRTILAALAAIVLVNLAGPIRNAFYQSEGANIVSSPDGSASILSTEVLGLISFIETALAVVAVLMIIISGLRAVVKWGSDEGTAELRKTIIGIIFGLIIISVKVVVSRSVAVEHEPNGMLISIVTVLNIVLGFTALVAVAVIVIAGFMMILNIGNEDQYTKARTLIIRVAIGLIVILSSLALANVVIFGTLN